MTILEALNKVPTDKWKLQSLQETFLRGEVKKKSAAITFQTTPELVLQMNAAAVLGGRLKTIGMIIWVDAEAWDAAKTEPAQPCRLISDDMAEGGEVGRRAHPIPSRHTAVGVRQPRAGGKPNHHPRSVTPD